MRRKRLSLFLLALIIIALPLLLISVKQTMDNRTTAAAPNKLEAESGILTGNAIIQTDSNASGVEFIQFGGIDKYHAIRLAWKDYITGGNYDKSDPQLKALVDAKISSIVTRARKNKNDLITTSNKTSLFTDIPNINEGKGINDTYERIEIMAQAYAINGAISDPAEKEEMYKSIKNSLKWLNNNWYNVNTCKGNDWSNSGPCPQSLVYQVGIPTSLTTSIILIYDRLIQDRDANEFLTKNMNTVERFYPNPRSNKSNSYYGRTEHDTAGNLAMTTIPLILRAGLSIDENKRKIALDEALYNFNQEFLPYVTTGEGLYKDGSFIQHNNHPYNLWYGAFYLDRVTDLSILLNNSGIQTSNPNLLYTWFKNAYQPFIFNTDAMDIVKGRTATYPRKNIIQNNIPIIESEIKILSMLTGEKYNDLGKDILDKTGRKIVRNDIFTIIQTYKLLKKPNLSGEYSYSVAKIFPRMDKAVVIKPNYAFAVSMSSNRTFNSAGSKQNENKKSWYMSDGMIYFYNKTDPGQYNDWFWATVDKTKLTGTTVDQQIKLDTDNNFIGQNFDTKFSNYLSPSRFAGGAVLDENHAALGMILSSALPKPVKAKKSWFFFENKLVAMGSDISGTSGTEVYTIVENRKINSTNNFSVDGKEITAKKDITSPRWAFLEGTGGYYFPNFEGSPKLTAIKQNRTGNWQQLSSKESAENQTRTFAQMWFDHGVNSTARKYAYVFLPNANRNEISSYSQNPDIQILNHGTIVHAVKDKSNTVMANFFGVGTASYINSENQSSIISKESSNSLSFTASDPTQNQDLLTFTLNKNAKSVISKDSQIDVVSLSPIKFKINTKGTKGKTFKINFAL